MTSLRSSTATMQHLRAAPPDGDERSTRGNFNGLPRWGDLMRTGDEITLRVNGDCMHPLIVDGACVVLRRRGCYIPGDIVGVRQKDGTLRLHRCGGCVYYRGRWVMLTRADNTAQFDAPATLHEVVGALTRGECSPSAFRVSYRTRARIFLDTVQYLGSQAWVRLLRDF